jgi:hypothetical protein
MCRRQDFIALNMDIGYMCLLFGVLGALMLTFDDCFLDLSFLLDMVLLLLFLARLCCLLGHLGSFLVIIIKATKHFSCL